MSEEPKGYKGYTNYETWAVNLWLQNDEGTYRQWRDAARQAKRDAARPGREHKSWSDVEFARFTLADRLKEAVDEAKPDLGASMWADLIGAALSEVNWHEVADAFLED